MKNICDLCEEEYHDDEFDKETNTCHYCLDKLQEEETRWVQVTREMARDAGDLGMEGQWIKW